MRVLGLDLGKRSGFAIVDGGVIEETGVIDCRKEPDDSGVFVKWATEFGALVVEFEPDVIAFEDNMIHRGKSFVPGMTALLYVEAQKHRLASFGINVRSLKKYARECAGISAKDFSDAKQAMLGALLITLPVTERAKYAALSDDEVDAVWVALWLTATAIISQPETEPVR